MKRKTISIALVLAMLAAAIGLTGCTTAAKGDVSSDTSAETSAETSIEGTASSKEASSMLESSSQVAPSSSVSISSDTTPDNSESSETEQLYGLRRKDITELSDEKKSKIKNDYLAYLKTTDDPYYNALYDPELGNLDDLTAEDVIIYYYYGTYNGAELVKISTNIFTGIPQLVVTKEIAGYNIEFADGGIYILHVGNSFMYMKDAYASGNISKQDVRDMLEPTIY